MVKTVLPCGIPVPFHVPSFLPLSSFNSACQDPFFSSFCLDAKGEIAVSAVFSVSLLLVPVLP